MDRTSGTVYDLHFYYPVIVEHVTLVAILLLKIWMLKCLQLNQEVDVEVSRQISSHKAALMNYYTPLYVRASIKGGAYSWTALIRVNTAYINAFHGISPIDLPLFCVSMFSEMKCKTACDSPNYELVPIVMASVLDPGGFDYEFDPPLSDDFMCSICHLAFKDPVQTLCGHRFCRECLLEFHRRWVRPCILFSFPVDSFRAKWFYNIWIGTA